MSAPESDVCPTCGSSAPHLHPAMQEGGEVQLCADAWHARITPENTPERRAEVARLLSGPYARNRDSYPDGVADPLGLRDRVRREIGRRTGIYEHTDKDGDRVSLSPGGDGTVVVAAYPADVAVNATVVRVPLADLLAALLRVAAPAPDREDDGVAVWDTVLGEVRADPTSQHRDARTLSLDRLDLPALGARRLAERLRAGADLIDPPQET